MPHFLDSERLNGPHATRLSTRPRRVAVPLASGDTESFTGFVERECQLWGGASHVVVPLDSAGNISDLYRNRLRGSQIDSVHGAAYDHTMAFDTTLDLAAQRDLSRYQLAVGLLAYGGSNDVPPLEIVTLGADDPWRLIYLACLGSLPDHIDPNIVRHGNWVPDLTFDDFVDVRRVETTGSLEDLLTRTWPRTPTITPRRLSMWTLSYASTASSQIRSAQPILPKTQFARYDAGPNIVVVCSPGSLDDLALLWNLRAAHGDFYATPIGLPSSALSPQSLSSLSAEGGLARHGISASSLYVTSCSVPLEDLAAAATCVADIAVVAPDDLLMFGTVLGWTRDEVLVWEDGRASYKALDMSRHGEILEKRNINEALMLHFDARAEDSPLPVSDDYRIDSFHDGAHSHWASPRFADKISQLEWPSRELMAQSLASIRDLELKESAPTSARKINWRCTARKHTWPAQVRSRTTLESGCPYCAGSRAIPGETDLATLHPGLAAEWDYQRNDSTITPETVAPGSERVAWWHGPCDHSWDAAIGARSSGQGCPYCSNQRTLAGFNDLATTHPELAEQWDHANSKTPCEITAGSDYPATWRCALGHMWELPVWGRTKDKTGCPVCANRVVLAGFNDLGTLDPRVASEWDHTPGANDRTPSEVTVSSSYEAQWRCADNHTWPATVANRHAGSGCPSCSGRVAIPGATDLAALRPDIAAQWDPRNNGSPDQFTVSSHEKVSWICDRHHSWPATIKNRTSGCGCPYCAGKLPIPGENDLATLRPDLAAQWDPANALSPTQVTIGSGRKVTWRCPCGYTWPSRVQTRTRRPHAHCPECRQ
ncbi:zinc-ribbon domain-containing protein [Microbacterium sp. NPDC008134]|uniref:zinc-ribbon domain-containing protein n=1 Tax=Microbacterium sp. NPDC008134 TaxID=3364183 RepID=UPI0036E232FA